MESIASGRRAVAKLLFLLLLLQLQLSCVQRVFYDVTVEGAGVSPAYQLRVINQTSQTLTFLPIPKFRSHYEPKPIEKGGYINCLIQVSRIKVGQTFSREIVAGPYIDSGRLGPDRADIRYRDSRDIRHEIAIDISHPSWFQSYAVEDTGGPPEPKMIVIRLTDESMSKSKWFAKGPEQP